MNWFDDDKPSNQTLTDKDKELEGAEHNRVLAIGSKSEKTPLIRQGLKIGATSDVDGRRKALGFLAKSFQFTNPTGQWFYVEALGTFIPPWTFNLVYNLAAGTQMIDIMRETPVGDTSNPQAGQYLMVVACSYEQVPTSGTLYTRFTP